MKNNKYGSGKIKSIGTKITIAFMLMIIPIILLGLISYDRSKNVVKQVTTDTAIQTIRQAGKYLELLLSKISNISKQTTSSTQFQDLYAKFEGTPDDSEFLMKMNQLKKTVNVHIANDPNIGAILFAYKPGLSMVSDGTYTDSGENLSYEAVKNSGWYKTFASLKKRSVWLGEHKELDAYGEGDYAERLKGKNYISIVSNVDIVNVERTKGLMIIDMKTDALEEMVNSLSFGNGSQTHIIFPDGRDLGYEYSAKTKTFTKAGYNAAESTFYKKIVSAKEPAGSSMVNADGKKLMIYGKVGETGVVLISLIPAANLETEANSIAFVTIILVILGGIFAAVIGLFIAGDVSMIINKAVNLADSAAKGDLTKKVETKRHDEFGKLMESLNEMIGGMKDIIGNSTHISEEVETAADKMAQIAAESSAATEEINKAMQEIANGASSQASDASEGVVKVEELSEKISIVVERTKDIERLSGMTMELTKSGQESVKDLNRKSLETSKIAELIIKDIMELGEHSHDISKIVSVLNNITDQTNLLALNAAIEAARAGDAGRGFAVVANEVKKLAEQSLGATGEIGDIIDAIQNITHSTVTKAKETENILKQQSMAVASTMDVFGKTADAMENLAKYLSEITISIEGMEKSKQETSVTIEHIASISTETAAAVEQVLASAEEQFTNVEGLRSYAEKLNESVKSLRDSMAVFKIEGSLGEA